MSSFRAAAVVLLASVLATVPARVAEASSADADPHASVRGMTVSCPGAGRIWGTDAMVETMEELRDLGVNWITIHPYAGIGADGTVGGVRLERMYDDAEWLTRPIREAHRLGLKIMIKPHIAYWGSPFSWRGEITFETETQWRRFFETYERWIVMVAALSADADAFVVGTELGGTVRHEAAWRRIIAAVRTATDAPLTYSANWDRYEQVGFWDALDAIGIQSYFPLVEHGKLPVPEELDRAWRDLIDRLEQYAERHQRDVILAELGYNRSELAARQPWDYRQGGAHAEEVQRRCMAAALRALAGSKRVSGAFLWKWFPGGRDHGHGNFLMTTPAMREVIAAHWGEASIGGGIRNAETDHVRE